MSKLPERVSKLEQHSGGSTVIAIRHDERVPLVDGRPQVRISGTDIVMALDEFEASYPDGTVIHIVFDEMRLPERGAPPLME